MVRKIVTESRTSLHNDTVCALLSCKLNCDRIAAGFKSSKVQLNAAKKKQNIHTNLIKPTRAKVRASSTVEANAYGKGFGGRKLVKGGGGGGRKLAN